MRLCPICKSSLRFTIKRKPYIKLIPGSKSYCCASCNTNYTWFRQFKTTVKI